MSRQIDLTQPLSKGDLQYLSDRNDEVALERAAAANAGRAFEQEQHGGDDDVKDVADMTVAELKDELEARELPHGGNKEELQMRLQEARSGDPEQ